MPQKKTLKIAGSWFSYSTQLFFCLSLALFPFTGKAFDIESRSGIPVENRFVVGPVKIELSVPLGGFSEAMVELENRTGRSETYEFSFEDFHQGEDSDVTLLGDQKGKRSLKDYLSVEAQEVTLLHGERVRIPVSISIPAEETPGGKFATLIVSAKPAGQSENQTGATVISRVAVLFFVTVPGDIVYEGSLQNFDLSKTFVFGADEISARLVFENRGSAHVNPYGLVTIRNMFGQVVSEELIHPWFVLPESLRTQDFEITSPRVSGWYKAVVQLNRGYDDVIDEREVSFFVISPTTLALVILGGIAVLWVKRKRIITS